LSKLKYNRSRWIPSRIRKESTVANKLAVAGPNSKFKQLDAEPAGFWMGFWHGLIAPITFVVSLFNPGVRFYETNNNGGWYDFGFILGASSSLGGSTTMNVNGGHDKDQEEAAEEAAEEAETDAGEG
jgi:hypothetical protein